MFPVFAPEIMVLLHKTMFVLSMITLVAINVHNHYLNKWFIGPPKPAHMYDD